VTKLYWSGIIYRQNRQRSKITRKY